MNSGVQNRASAIVVVEKARKQHRYHISSGHFRDSRNVYRGTHVPTARNNPTATA